MKYLQCITSIDCFFAADDLKKIRIAIGKYEFIAKNVMYLMTLEIRGEKWGWIRPVFQHYFRLDRYCIQNMFNRLFNGSGEHSTYYLL